MVYLTPMKKTSVYIPPNLKTALERFAEDHGESEAEVIREAIEAMVGRAAGPRPRLPLGERLGDPGMARETLKKR